jgi:hypothetical protein
MMPHPAPLEFFFNVLAVPLDERQLPLQRVLDTGHILEIRAERGRHFLCGLLNELPVEPNDSLIESLLEEPFQPRASGFLAYEPMEERLVYSSEILSATEPGGAPSPDLPAFLRELTELSKKVSLAGAL